MTDFDPHHIWLGIPPHQQPPDHYRLLGVELFETSASVIENASERQMAHIRGASIGPHRGEAQQLLNEIAKARSCLLNPKQREAYDAQLRQSLSSSESPAVAHQVRPEQPLPQAVPVASSPSRPATGSAATHGPVPVPIPVQNVNETQRSAPTPRIAPRSAAARKRRLTRSAGLEFTKVILGGVAGVGIALVLLQFVFHVDILGLESSPDKPIAESPSSPSSDAKSNAAPRTSSTQGALASKSSSAPGKSQGLSSPGSGIDDPSADGTGSAAQTQDRAPADSQRNQGSGAASSAADDGTNNSATTASSNADDRRTWTDHTGAFRIEAELKGYEAGVVTLKQPDGTEVPIPLIELSESDAVHVARQVTDPVQLSDDVRSAPQLEQFLQDCPRSEDAFCFVWLFLAREDVADVEKDAVRAKLPYWQKLAQENRRRYRGRWIAAVEYKERSEEEEDCIVQAIAALRAGDLKDAVLSLKKAQNANVESTKGPFVSGLVRALLQRDPTEARTDFREVISRIRRRGPFVTDRTRANQVAALNNLALTQLRLQRWDDVVDAWAESMDLTAKAPPEFVHNVCRFRRLLSDDQQSPGQLLSKEQEASFVELCGLVDVANDTFSGAGWVYMPYHVRSTESGDGASDVAASQPAKPVPSFPAPAPSEDQSGRSEDLAGLSPMVRAASGRTEEFELTTIMTNMFGRPWTCLEDPWCLLCSGLGHFECPVRKCAQGRIGVPKTEALGRNPVTGGVITQTRMVRVPCKHCKGQGRVKCDNCTDGRAKDVRW